MVLRPSAVRKSSVTALALAAAIACGSSKKPPPAIDLTTDGSLSSGGASGASTGGQGTGTGGTPAAGGARDGGGVGGAGGAEPFDAAYGAGGLGMGGAPWWMNLEAGASTGGSSTGLTCPVSITFTCADFCTALAAEPNCSTYLQKLQSSLPPPDTGYRDGGLDGSLEICGCACETTLRTVQCHSKFDDFIQCGTPPLSAVCATIPQFAGDFPELVGACGAARSAYLDCVAMFP